MKVILLEDVKKVGKKGEIVELSDAYARNCIINKKLGLEATGKNLNDLKLQKANAEKIAQQEYEAALKLAEEIREMEVKVSIKTGAGGKVFGSVSTKEVAAAVKAQCGIELDKKKMQLAEPIKSAGVHLVPVRIHPKVTAELKVKVGSEE